jgi:hypothetical protein
MCYEDDYTVEIIFVSRIGSWYLRRNPCPWVKNTIDLNYTQKCVFCIKENRLRLCYKIQFFNIVYGKNLFLITAFPATGLDRPLGFQEVEAPEFLDCRHRKVVSLSALRTGRLYPQEGFLVLISVIGWVDPKDTMRPEWLSHWKTPVTPSGIKPATIRLVAQCLNKMRHRVPSSHYRTLK